MFNIGVEQAQYRLEVGTYSRTAGDSLGYHKKMAFTTKDSDNDKWSKNFAVQYTGVWWYESCRYSSLNGKYVGNKLDNRGTKWMGFRASLSLKFPETEADIVKPVSLTCSILLAPASIRVSSPDSSLP